MCWLPAEETETREAGGVTLAELGWPPYPVLPSHHPGGLMHVGLCPQLYVQGPVPHLILEKGVPQAVS